MHVRADIIQAFEDAIGAVPIVAAVYDYAANVPPPSGKVTVELGLADEGPNRRIDGGSLPNEAVLERKLKFGALVTAAVPRDMTAKDLEANVIAPIEIAVANCQALASLADDWIMLSAEWHPAQDSQVQTLSVLLIWDVTYTTAAGAPGQAL